VFWALMLAALGVVDGVEYFLGVSGPSAALVCPVHV
jgi:hypothetical protein